jgi:RHS repeat-associated protein
MSTFKKIFFIILLFSIQVLYGSHQTVVNSLAGNIPNMPLQAGKTITTSDQWYNYVTLHQSTYHNVLSYSNKKARVVLRFDDSRKQICNLRFGVQVIYLISLQDETGTTFQTISGFSQINYEPGEGLKYNDIEVQEYPGAVSATLKVLCVNYYEDVANGSAGFPPYPSCSSSILPVELSDVYLDLEISNDKYYNLDVNTPPVTTFPVGFSASTTPLNQNQLAINWNYVAGAESYDLEWLFIDIPNKIINISGNVVNNPSFSPTSYNYDFRNSTRVNVSENSFSIPMSYPSGLLIFRVRAVGYTLSSSGVATATVSNWSSYNANVGTNIPQSTYSVPNFAYRYDFTGMKADMNWSYSASYVEEGKRQEAAVYSDGVSKERQHITLNYTDSTAIISETKYDYQGRAAIQIIPTPTVNNQGLIYYQNFATGFGKNNFDIAYGGITPVNKQTGSDPVPNTDMSGIFYSTQASSTGNNDYIPIASGYPYAMTTFLNDGTDRIAKSSGVGIDNRIGSNHETKYYYGSVNSQTEIDAMFGNEVGDVSHYHKTMVRDPNGQVSISYHDQEDRTIATCIAGPAPSNLVALDNTPAFSVVTDNILAGNDHLDQNGNVSVNSDIIVPAQSVYTFTYSLNSICASNPGCDTYCPTCIYDINIYVVDQDNGAVQQLTVLNSPAPTVVPSNNCISVGNTNAISCNQVNSITVSFSALLNTGKYKVVKILSLNQSNLTSLQNQYVISQNLTHSCVHIDPIKPVDCATDCNSLCTASYEFKNADGSITYLDQNGNTTTQSVAQALINQCLVGCNSGISPPSPSNPSSITDCINQCEHSYSYTVSNIAIGRFSTSDSIIVARTYSPDGGGYYTVYIDGNGNIITQAQAQILITQCEQNCGSNNIPGSNNDPCQGRETIIQQDMSPGGQYFDNTYNQYTVDASGNAVTNSFYNINGWLNTMSSVNQAALLSAINGSVLNPGIVYNNFNDIRSHWVSGYENITMKYHPEFPLLKALCAGTFCTTTGKGVVPMTDINTYNQQIGQQTSLSIAESLGYLNPLDYSTSSASGTFSSTDFSIGNTTYMPSSYFASTTVAGDPIFKCNNTFCCQAPKPYPTPYPNNPNVPPSPDRYLMPVDTLNADTTSSDTTGIANRGTCTQTAYAYFDYRLKNFFNIPSTTSYFSIWYVMDDPMNIHTAVGSNNNYTIGGNTYTIPDAVVQYFQGLAQTGVYTNSSTKYSFFLSNYRNLRDLLIYELKVVPLSPALPLQNMGNYYTVAHANPPGPQDHYMIRIQGNPFYASAAVNICSTGPLFNANAINTSVVNTNVASCAPACQQYVSSIISQFGSCLGSNTSLAQSLMNSLCTNACQQGVSSNPSTSSLPTSGCDPTSNASCTQTAYVTYNSQHLYTFNEILNALGCTGANVQSIGGTSNTTTSPATNSVSCACSNLTNYIGNYVASVNDGLTNPIIVLNSQQDPLAYSYSSVQLSDITNQVNNITNPAGSYSTSDIQSFFTFCDNPVNTASNGVTLPANFPQNFVCQSIQALPLPPAANYYSAGNCGCQNLNMFVNSFGYNPLADLLNSSNPNQTTNLQIVASDVNDAFQLTGSAHVTSANVLAWLTECNNTASGHPDGSVLISNNFPSSLQCPNTGNSAQDALTANCIQQSLAAETQASATHYFNALHTSSVAYVNSYKQKCLNINSLDPSHQAFSMSYTNYLFMYTLYYFDQADNLVKTIPPEGYNPVPASIIANVDHYRHHTYPSPVYPNHGLVTNYKFSTLNHVTQQTTPDGGITNYWYDALGRLAVSQNKKQTTSTATNVNAQNTPYSTFAKPSFSYTRYDNLGRIVEVGECQNSLIPPSLAAGTPFDVNNWFVNSNNYREVTSTFYDQVPLISVFPSTPNYTNWQQNLRNRIAAVMYVETANTYPISATDRISANHYSYDIHGNIISYVQEDDAHLNGTVNQYKRTDYEFDIVSGKVNAVHYQAGLVDQMHHKYYYDNDNRLHLVFTSHDNSIWEKEAKYFYYANGPLSRTEIGDKQVAGQDHTYTIQGWLKSVNNDYLNSNYDIGKDALVDKNQYQNLDKYVATDAMGFTLGYFSNDYKQRYQGANQFPVNITEVYSAGLTNAVNQPFNHLTVNSTYNTNLTASSSANLYNGNISRMVTSMYDNSQNRMGTQARLYFYDQLNRIKYANDFSISDPFTLPFNPNQLILLVANNNNYYEDFTYDYNGNIKKLNRYGLNSSQNPTLLYNMSYNYKPSTISGLNIDNNKLLYIQDPQNGLGGVTQTSTNYQYDDIGGLTENDQEEIANIEWNVYGKIRYIKRQTSSTKPDMEYIYSPIGLRIEKIEHAKSGTNYYTFYAHDAQGNVMSVYTQASNVNNTFILAEQHIYGSSRLGMAMPNYNTTGAPLSNLYIRTLGQKQYELSNHLGNVLNTILDKKLPIMGNTYYKELYCETDGISTTAQAYQGHASDLLYGPYPTSNHVFSSGFDQIAFSAGDVINLSGYFKTSGGNSSSGVVLAVQIFDANNQQAGWYAIHANGNSLGWTPNTFVWTAPGQNTGGTPYNVAPPTGYTFQAPYYLRCYAANFDAPSSSKPYVYVDNLTINVVSSNTQQYFNHYTADVQNATDYYAFGSPMNGRNFVGTNSYRYGFNDKEKDNEVDAGVGNTMDFGARIYDDRIGRFFRTDPAHSAFPFETPYSFAGNTPIQSIDVEGERVYFVNKDGTILDLSVAGNIDKIDDASFKAAYKTLVSTLSGDELMTLMNTKYDNHDVYIARSKLNVYHNDAGASTLHIKKEGQTNFNVQGGILSDKRAHQTFNAVTASKSVDKDVYGIILPLYQFNIGSGNSGWDKNSNKYTGNRYDQYELAEALYHEIWAHIFYKIEHPNADGEVEHQAYGSYNMGLDPQRSLTDHNLSNQPMTVRATDATPYKKMVLELLQLKTMPEIVVVAHPQHIINKKKKSSDKYKIGYKPSNKGKHRTRAKF